MNELVLQVHTIGHRAGLSKEVRREIAAPAELGTAAIGVPENSPIALDLLLQSVSEGIYVSGTIDAQTVGECVRCLDPLAGATSVPIDELFLYPEAVTRAVDDGDEDAQEMYVSDGDTLDLEGALRDAVVTALPFQPLCRDDCPGLCPTCGVRLADAEEGHRHDVIDPRLAVLAELLEEDDS